MRDDEARDLGRRFAAIDPWARYPFPPQGLHAYFAAKVPGSPRYALRAGDVVVGAIGLKQEWMYGPYIQFLGLLPGHQAQGTGARVLSWCEDAARAEGERNLWVAASDFNTRAIGFYERFGFERVATLDSLVRDGVTEILFRKKL